MPVYTTPIRYAHGLVALMATLPVGAWAAAGREGAPAGLFDGAYLLQVFGSLLLVFGCIFGLILLLKKLNGLPLASGSPIRVLASARVGSREKIVLLEAGEQQLLVGVAAGGIRTLHVFDEPLPDTSTARGKGADFASLLRSSSPVRDLS